MDEKSFNKQKKRKKKQKSFCSRKVLNLRLLGCEPTALPTSLPTLTMNVR